MSNAAPPPPVVAKGFYAVASGHVPGIYATWAEAEAQVKGFSKAVHKKCETKAEAEQFMAESRPSISSTIPPPPSTSASTQKESEMAEKILRENKERVSQARESRGGGDSSDEWEEEDSSLSVLIETTPTFVRAGEVTSGATTFSMWEAAEQRNSGGRGRMVEGAYRFVGPLPPISPPSDAESAKFLGMMCKVSPSTLYRCAQAAFKNRPPLGVQYYFQSPLSGDQQRAMDIATSGSNLFFTGKAGAGKSTTLKAIVWMLEKMGKRVAVTSTTGVAATVIGGTTVHRWAGVGIGKKSVDKYLEIFNDGKHERVCNRWSRTDVLVIDEVSMLDHALFEKLDLIAKGMRGNQDDFVSAPTPDLAGPLSHTHRPRFQGRIQLIVSGDFAQLLPFEAKKYIFESPVFQRCFPMSPHSCVVLKKSFRQEGDDELAGILDELRVGVVSDACRQMLAQCRNTSFSAEQEAKCVHLFPSNKKADERNDERLGEIADGDDIVESVATDTFGPQCNSETNSKFNYRDRLRLAVGARVMLLKNTDVDRGLANGSRGTVTGFEYGESGKELVGVNVQFDKVGDMEGAHARIGKGLESVDAEQPLPEPLATRLQFPLQLAWAMTIHKSQGQTCEVLRVHLLGCERNPGQAYTALSRATSASALRVTGFTASNAHICADPRVVDYLEQLDRL
jgi:ATP-dependent DNA helicase PIF1